MTRIAAPIGSHVGELPGDAVQLAVGGDAEWPDAGPVADSRSAHRIRVTAQVDLKPGDDGGLPFKITAMKVRSSECTGSVRFDAKAGRPVRSDAEFVADFDMTVQVNLFQVVEANKACTFTSACRFFDRKPDDE